MLFRSQHEDGEHQLRSEEHLYEEPLNDFRSSPEGCTYDQWSREQDAHNACTRYATGYLGDDDEASPKP